MLACSPSYSFSNEIVYGSTGNAAGSALTWSMANVLPQQAGLQVGNVIYQYTTVKDPEDDMLVHVQNENPLGNSYTFRETDDWSGLPANTINKIVAVDNIPIELWGDGSIQVEGKGEVINPNVVYTYKYDPCYNPQSDPSCPNYQPPTPEPEVVSYDVYDALDDQAVLRATEETDPELYDRDNKRRQQQARAASDDRLERGLAASENALNLSSDIAQDFMIDALANERRFDPYYVQTISGGIYRDTVTLPTKDLPDNKRALRNNLAQQLLHKEMIEQQYK